MAEQSTLIPSDYLRAVSPEIAEPFFRMRDAAKNRGPLDQTTYELILLTGLAILNHEEVFKVHATRAKALGISKQALQHAMLVMLGSTLTIQGVTRSLRWIDTIYDAVAAT